MFEIVLFLHEGSDLEFLFIGQTEVNLLKSTTHVVISIIPRSLLWQSKELCSASISRFTDLHAKWLAHVRHQSSMIHLILSSNLYFLKFTLLTTVWSLQLLYNVLYLKRYFPNLKMIPIHTNTNPKIKWWVCL